MKKTLFVLMLVTFSNASYAVSAADEIKSCKAAWDHAKKKQYEKAYKLSSAKKCPLTQRYLLWEKLRNEDIQAPFEDYRAFVTKNSNWPWMPQILRKAESSMPESLSAQETVQWFSRHEPKTGWGFKLYLAALSKLGDQQKLARQAKHYWHHFDFTAEREQTFTNSYGHLLSPEDHKIRLSRLFFEEKDEQIARMIARFPPEEQKIIQARLRLMKNETRPQEVTPQTDQQHLGFLYEQIRWHRKQDHLNGAHLLNQISPDQTASPEWTKERLYLAREAFNQGQPELAYATLKNHPFKSGREYEEAEWFSGWLALRFMNQAEQALQHFQNYKAVVKQADSITKANYWLGRTYEALGKKDEAQAAFKAAMTYKGTYYSTLAQDKVLGKVKVKYDKEKPIDKEAWQKFQKQEFVQVARLLKAAGQPDHALPFLYMLGKRAHAQSEKRLAIHLIQEVLKGYTIFAARDIGLVENRVLPWLYPTKAIKERALKQGVDPKLMHAIMRQESGFHEKAVSPAGASGLMQVMPATAEKLAKRHQYKHKKVCLTNDPDYNMLLGSHFLKEMLDRYDGVYVLAIAAYNAGPRPINEWIERYGHPGNPNVDLVDWIESIPYKETRGYVKSVLANYRVYSSLQTAG